MIRKKIMSFLVLATVPVLYFTFFDSTVDLAHSPIEKVQASAQVKVLPSVVDTPAVIRPASNPGTAQIKPVIKVPPEASMNPLDRIRAIQEKTELHKSVLSDYDTFSRYPASNQRIQEAAQDPLTKRYSIDERTTMSEDKDAALTIWSDKKYYLRGEQVKVFATIQDANGQRVASEFAAQLIFNERQSVHQFDFSDDNQDGVYELDFIADQVAGKLLTAGVYKVLVVNKMNELADAVAFILSDPGARFTGNYRDVLTPEGNLRIEAEVDVSVKDRFYFQASLYTELSDPIGSTQATVNLATGMHWVPLDFYGLLIRDAGEQGPYLLKQLSLAKVTLPMQRAPLITPNYYTKPYQLNQFASVRYEQVAKLQ